MLLLDTFALQSATGKPKPTSSDRPQSPVSTMSEEPIGDEACWIQPFGQLFEGQDWDGIDLVGFPELSPCVEGKMGSTPSYNMCDDELFDKWLLEAYGGYNKTQEHPSGFVAISVLLFSLRLTEPQVDVVYNYSSGPPRQQHIVGVRNMH